MRYEDGKKIRRGDRFKLDYVGIVVDLFKMGKQKMVTVFWTGIHPVSGKPVEPDHVFPSEEYEQIGKNGPTADNLQTLDGNHFAKYARKVK